MAEQIQQPVTTTYSIERVRVRKEGLIQIPVADDGEVNCEVARLHAPTELLKIIWIATQFGAPPEVPSPTALVADPNIVLLETEIGAIVPMIDSLGQAHHWGLSGTYTYLMKKPKAPVSSIPTGRYPWEKTPASENTIPAASFKDDILYAK